jgi:hypothetical protein
MPLLSLLKRPAHDPVSRRSGKPTSLAAGAVAFVLFAACYAGEVRADIIIVPDPPVNRLLSSQIMFHQEIGQTFTAETFQIETVGFFVTDVNAFAAPNDFTLMIDLFEGVGSSGPALGSRIFSGLSDDFNGWTDVDFSDVELVVGQQYTVLISNDTVRWFVHLNNDFYEGGDAIYLGSVLDGSDSFATSQNAGLKGAGGTGVDIEFRVLGVPEPSTALLVAAGLLALGVRRKAATKTCSLASAPAKSLITAAPRSSCRSFCIPSKIL